MENETSRCQTLVKTGRRQPMVAPSGRQRYEVGLWTWKSRDTWIRFSIYKSLKRWTKEAFHYGGCSTWMSSVYGKYRHTSAARLLLQQTLSCSLISHLLLFSVQKDIGGKSSMGPGGIWELLNAITKWISVCGTSTGVWLDVLTDTIFYFKIQPGFIESKG